MSDRQRKASVVSKIKPFLKDFDGAAHAFFTENRKAISDTQWAAFQKGTVGFEGSLFQGKPDWKGLLEREAPSLTPEEQSFLDNETEELCRMIDDWKVREELKDLDPRVWDYLRTKGFFGLEIPKEYGGKEFSTQGHAAIVSKIASRCATAGATAMVPNSLGPAKLILHTGTQKQKDDYLPRLARGEEIPCFALTSPWAGSDAFNQRDTGVVFKDDDGNIKIRLNWDKRYTTLAPVSTLFGIAYDLQDPDNLLGKGTHPGTTLGLVPSNTPGVIHKQRHRPPYPFQNGPHWGHDVIVPVDSIIGGPEQAGNGDAQVLDCLTVGRALSLPAGAAGLAKYALRVSTAYVAIRQQFGTSLANMGGIQEQIGQMASLTYMIDAIRMGPLQDVDLDPTHEARPAITSAILKYHTTEAARKIADAAVEVHGGKGVVGGPENPVGHLRDTITVSSIVEGANILTRCMMIFGLGIFVGHPYALKEMETADTGDIAEAGRLMRAHIRHAFKCAARGYYHGKNGGHKLKTPIDGPESKFCQHIERLSIQAATLAEMSMLTLGPRLLKEERISARHGDILSNLYMASLVIRRFNYEGRIKEDIPLMQRAVTQCLYDAEQAMTELIRNHPSPLVRENQSIFQPKTWIQKPLDHLDKEITEAICKPSAMRDRLTQGIFVPTEDDEYMVRLEKALAAIDAVRADEYQLAQAIKKKIISNNPNLEIVIDNAEKAGILPEDRIAALRKANRARDQIIQVNHFPMEWHGKPMTPNQP